MDQPDISIIKRDLRAENAGLQKQLSERSAELRQREADLRQRDLELTQVRQGVEHLYGLRNADFDRYQTLSAKNSKLLADLDSAKQEVERLTIQLAKRTSEQDKLSSELEQHKNALTNLKAQRAHMTEALGHCNAAHHLRNQSP